MQLGLKVALAGLIHQCQRLGQRRKSFPRLPRFAIRLGEFNQQKCPCDLCSRGSPGSPPLAELRHPTVCLSLQDHPPTPQDYSLCQSERNPSLGREGYSRLSLLLGCVRVPAKRVEVGRPRLRTRQTEVMRQLVS